MDLTCKHGTVSTWDFKDTFKTFQKNRKKERKKNSSSRLYTFALRESHYFDFFQVVSPPRKVKDRESVYLQLVRTYKYVKT